ncbi:5-oxoprolinase subunit PxpA [Bacillus sp. S13(2024)]|uniref:5-oxoprolinase subunit PxpA n=1 Tax=unclassified Bacillus (in: firmicutes) TaxID=185979 RepID=UPI003D1C7386
MKVVDLNCDLGESFGAYNIGNDDAILPYVSSVNIACGFHAGDPSVMHSTVAKALEHRVSIGAHPGLPDLIGFGRRMMHVSPDEVYDYMIYQIGALDGFIRALGGKMNHVKPHGALYNLAAVNSEIADAIAKAIYKVNPELLLFGLASSEFVRAGEKYNLRVVQEVFADRTYQSNGTLTNRTESNALITNEEDAIRQVLQMVQKGNVPTVDGTIVSIAAHTICIHGDGLHAVDYAKSICNALQQAQIKICAP